MSANIAGTMTGAQKRKVHETVKAVLTRELREFDAASGSNIVSNLRDLRERIREVVQDLRATLTYLGQVTVASSNGSFDPQSLRSKELLLIDDTFIEGVLSYARPVDTLPALSMGMYRQVNRGYDSAFRKCLPADHAYSPTEFCYVLTVLATPPTWSEADFLVMRNHFYVRLSKRKVVEISVIWRPVPDGRKLWHVSMRDLDRGDMIPDHERRVFSRTKP